VTDKRFSALTNVASFEQAGRHLCYLKNKSISAKGIVSGFGVQLLSGERLAIYHELKNRFGNVAALRQKHSDRILIPSGDNSSSQLEIYSGDAMISDKRGLVLTVHTADCLPILFFGEDRMIGAIHAGWRGTLREIAPKAVTLAMRNYAISLDKLKFIFMPSIQKCCYEVSSEVAVLFRNHQRNNKGQLTIDIAQENKIQLTELGIPEQNIQISKECTYCYPGFDYPSFRKDGRIRRRMVNFIVRC